MVQNNVGPRSLTERVYVSLRGDLHTGRITPGQKLRPRELATVHGVSLNVVREALSRLAGERLVRALPQQGFVVMEISADDLVDLVEVRIMIETQALRRSIERGGLAWETAIVGAHHQLAGTPLSVPECPAEASAAWMRAHNAFHRATMAECGSPRLLEIISSLTEAAAVYRFWSHRYDHGDRDVAAEHRAIFEAVINRDADLACRLHQQHISHTADVILAELGTQDNVSKKN